MPEPLPPPAEPLATPARPRPQRSARATRALDVLKTLVWVVPLTMLLWFYAERAQTFDPKVTIPIDIRVNSPSKRVTLINPADGKVVVTLSGPRASVERLTDKISANPDHAIVSHTLDALTPRGPVQIPMSVIGDDDLFKKAGITVKEPTPVSIQVSVDDVVTRALPVRASSGNEELEGDVRFTPATVQVTAPLSVFEQAAEKAPDKTPYLTADLSKLGDVLKVPGVHRDQPGIPIRFESISALGAKFDPPTVSANFVVKQTLQTYTRAGIPIWGGGPIDFQHTNEGIPASKSLPSLTFVGPEAGIKLLKEAIENNSGPYAPFAGHVYVFEEGDKTCDVHFVLPDGVHLSGNSDPTVDVHVTPRKQ